MTTSNDARTGSGAGEKTIGQIAYEAYADEPATETWESISPYLREMFERIAGAMDGGPQTVTAFRKAARKEFAEIQRVISGPVGSAEFVERFGFRSPTFRERLRALPWPTTDGKP